MGLRLKAQGLEILVGGIFCFVIVIIVNTVTCVFQAVCVGASLIPPTRNPHQT